MPISDLVTNLRVLGYDASARKVRWLIATGKIARPRIDGSGCFDFTHADLLALAELLLAIAQRRQRRKDSLQRQAARRAAKEGKRANSA
jgi:hypothetical protein